MSTGFTNSYLLASITTSIAASGDVIRRLKEEMDQLIKNELMPMPGSDVPLSESRRVLWEEKITNRTSSILDTLIPASNLDIEALYAIRYVKKKGNVIIHGASVLRNLRSGPEWQINGAFAGAVKKTRREWQEEGDSQADTDFEVDEDSMIETDASWSQQSFEAGSKRPHSTLKVPEEKNWERLLRSIYYAMRSLIREADAPSDLGEVSSSTSDSQHQCRALPFNSIPESRYWSSEFSATPVPDATDSRKPDLVLMDYRLRKRGVEEKSWSDVLTGIEITRSELCEGHDVPVFLGVATKGYLILRAQPWRRFVLLFSIANFKLRGHYLDRSGMIISAPISIGPEAVRFVDVINATTFSDHSSLGLDPTIHLCNNLCCGTPHDDLDMPVGARGWVKDDIGDVYWIMVVLWQSRGLFSRGTVCYRVRSSTGIEYALKDCWVDADCLDHEVTLLKAVDGIQNVVRLVKYWDVEFGGEVDTTSRIRTHIRDHLPSSPIYVNKVHRRMLLTPCGLPLTSFTSLPELLNVFQDVVVAHEAMVRDRNVLHGDLSPNNLIIHQGKGYFIDFDHAKFLKDNKALDSRGTGTIPYMSFRLLKLMGDAPSPIMIDHRASDDLESLFYILLEFTSIYEGPGGKRTDEGVHPVNAPRWRKAYITMDRDGLGTSGTLKKDFFIDQNPKYEPAPYFQACRPILEEWRKAIGSAILSSNDVSHGAVREIIKRGIERIESLPPVQVAPSSTSLDAAVSRPLPTSSSNTTPQVSSTIAAPPASSSVASSSLPPPAAQEASFQPRRSSRRNLMPPPPSPVFPDVPASPASDSTAQEQPWPRRSTRRRRT